MCYALELIFLTGDSNNDQKLSTSECTSFLEVNSFLISSFWNGYDTSWWSMSSEEKCANIDSNIDGNIHPDEMIALSKHLMTLNITSEATLQWEFENRFKQVSCEQCDWYEVYNFTGI